MPVSHVSVRTALWGGYMSRRSGRTTSSASVPGDAGEVGAMMGASDAESGGPRDGERSGGAPADGGAAVVEFRAGGGERAQSGGGGGAAVRGADAASAGGAGAGAGAGAGDPLARLRAMTPPPVVWRMARAVAEGLCARWPVANPDTGVRWTATELGGETWEAWMIRTGRRGGGSRVGGGK